MVYGEDEIAYQIGETTEILSRGHLCATPHCVRVLSLVTTNLFAGDYMISNHSAINLLTIYLAICTSIYPCAAFFPSYNNLACSIQCVLYRLQLSKLVEVYFLVLFY